jgi:hypothetical protein
MVGLVKSEIVSRNCLHWPDLKLDEDVRTEMRGSTAFFLHLHYLESTFSIDCVAALLLTSL